MVFAALAVLPVLAILPGVTISVRFERAPSGASKRGKAHRPTDKERHSNVSHETGKPISVGAAKKAPGEHREAGGKPFFVHTSKKVSGEHRSKKLSGEHRKSDGKRRSADSPKKASGKDREYRKDWDGSVVTYEEIAVKYQKHYSKKEIVKYWKEQEKVAIGTRGTFDVEEFKHFTTNSFGEKADIKDFPMPWEIKIPEKSLRPEDPSRTTLGNLLRYLNKEDEEHYPRLLPMLPKMSKQYDGVIRLTSPFEHVCGGNQEFNRSSGNNGRSNFISFLNADNHIDVGKDCKLYYDKGQRRAIINASRIGHGAIVIDISSYEKALPWCYYGGSVRTEEHEFRLLGAKDVSPFPFMCAKRAWTQHLKCLKCGEPPEDWWSNPYNRKLIAHKCAQWAAVSAEVLVMPSPDALVPGASRKSRSYVEVKTDRYPVKKLCLAHIKDRCVSIDKINKKVCCCSDPTCTDDTCAADNN